MNVNKLVVHHSASKKSTTKDEIEKWHKDRGFSEIGYHMVIEAKGVQKEGRSESKAGAHAKGANSDSLGVCVTGNFEEESPDTEQIDTLITVLAGWCKKYSLDEFKIYGHYNAPGGSTVTDCPGKYLKAKLDEVKLKVKEKVKNG
jgi:N-acetylmuramoyl-L-alanine amidase